MRVLVVGSKNWNNYNEFIRNMTIVIEDISVLTPEEKKIVFVHTGLQGAENMVTEYVGKVDRFMKQKGYSVKEELVCSKYSGNKVDKITADYDMITSGIDSAIIFVKQSDRRADYCLRLLKEFDVPTKVIKDK